MESEPENKPLPETPEQAPEPPPSPAAAQPAPARVPRSVRRMTAAADSLRTLLRDHYLDRFGAASPPPGPLEISLRLQVDPARGWQVTFLPPIEEQVDEQFADAQAVKDVLRRGRVYCFRCASTDCEHAVPPSPSHVFRGYSSTGTAEWCELVQALVDMQDEEMHLLYEERPQVLARTQPGHALRYRQLSIFGRGSRTYSILGQVVAGYFPLRRPGGPSGQPPVRLAVTLQAVEVRDRRGRLRLALNAVPGALGAGEFEEWAVQDTHFGLAESVARTEEALQALGIRAEDARRGGMAQLKPLMRQVPVLLARLARQIEQRARQGARRTRHAADRRGDRRPIHKALDDALAARAGSVFHDERRATYVVCARQGRAHVFSPEARHVTSFVVQPAEIEFRVRTRRWRPLEGEELQSFLARVALAAKGAGPAGAGPGGASG